jgi:hypothetical protein
MSDVALHLLSGNLGSNLHPDEHVVTVVETTIDLAPGAPSTVNSIVNQLEYFSKQEYTACTFFLKLHICADIDCPNAFKLNFDIFP